MPKVEVIPVGKISGKEAARYRSLTFRDDGCMASDFNYARKRLAAHSKVLSIKDENDKILAWALVMPRGRYLDFEVYTRSTERRKGYGTALYRRAVQLAGSRGKLIVHPHDDVSRGFFRQMNSYNQAKDFK